MDITPMSLQAVVPRTSEATQVQQNLNQQANIQQDYQALQDKAEMRLKETTVQARERAEDGRIKDDPDRRKKQGGYGRGNGRNKRKDDEQDDMSPSMAVDSIRGHHIDIEG